MTAQLGVLFVVAVIGLMTFTGWLAERLGPNPFLDERRQAYPDVAERRRKRELAGVLIGTLVVVFVAALVWPQGRPA